MPPSVILSYAYTHIHVHAGYILTQWITASEEFFRKICTSHFIVRVWKGLLRVLLWEGVGDRTELQIYDPQSYGRQRCVFLVLQGCSTGGPGAQLSAECWPSLPHLVTNGSLKLMGAFRAPSSGSGFPYHILATSLDPNSSGPQGPLPPGFLYYILSATSTDPNCLTSCLYSVI